eukprot:13340619-Ditylum_brightwellii.AAC.1
MENMYIKWGKYSGTCGSSIWTGVILLSRRLWCFISTQIFLSCNGVYGINKAIERPTVFRQQRSDNTNSATTIISS